MSLKVAAIILAITLIVIIVYILYLFLFTSKMDKWEDQ